MIIETCFNRVEKQNTLKETSLFQGGLHHDVLHRQEKLLQLRCLVGGTRKVSVHVMVDSFREEHVLEVFLDRLVRVVALVVRVVIGEADALELLDE